MAASSAYAWLELPGVPDVERVFDPTMLPVLMLGGDPSGDAHATYATWRRALERQSVAGLVLGRAPLYPPDGDVAAAVDTAAGLGHAR